MAGITGAGLLLLGMWAAVTGWLRRRRGERLLCTADLTPLLTARASLGPLEVRYQGEPVEQPALAELRFRFATLRDMPSAAFDADRLRADIAALLRVLTAGGSVPVADTPPPAKGRGPAPPARAAHAHFRFRAHWRS